MSKNKCTLSSQKQCCILQIVSFLIFSRHPTSVSPCVIWSVSDPGSENMVRQVRFPVQDGWIPRTSPGSPHGSLYSLVGWKEHSGPALGSRMPILPFHLHQPLTDLSVLLCPAPVPEPRVQVPASFWPVLPAPTLQLLPLSPSNLFGLLNINLAIKGNSGLRKSGKEERGGQLPKSRPASACILVSGTHLDSQNTIGGGCSWFVLSDSRAPAQDVPAATPVISVHLPEDSGLG